MSVAAAEEVDDLEHQDDIEAARDFLDEYYLTETQELDHRYSTQRSITIDHGDFSRFDNQSADGLIDAPEDSFAVFDVALTKNMDTEVGEDDPDPRVYIENLPDTTAIRQITYHDFHKLRAVEGIIRKATPTKSIVTSVEYRCVRCNEPIPREQNVDNKDPGEISAPRTCSGCDREGPFELQPETAEYRERQYLKVSEPPESIGRDTKPQSIPVVVEGDLTGEVAPGDRVTINGVVKPEVGQSKTWEKYIDCRGIEVEEQAFEDLELSQEDREAIDAIAETPSDELYDMLVESVAPSIHGYETEKLAMLLQLFGGVPKPLEDGSDVRGDSHILLVGDPGTGKSQCLQYIDNLAPRSVYTSGKGSTAAGLTAAAVQDDFADETEWTLEAGALPLADQGVACVDELDKMAPEHRDGLNEAISEQQISINKAGINATLKSRCKMLAAANPVEGRWNDHEAIAPQIGLDPDLISRFDLIFKVTDDVDREEDAELAEHILKSNEIGERLQSGRMEELNGELDDVSPTIEPELLQKYIAYSQANIHPVMSEEAKSRFEDFYVEFRGQAEGAQSVPVTARKLEALVRIAEASARARLSEDVEEEDADRAIELVTRSLKDVGLDPETGEFDIDFMETDTNQSQRERRRRICEIIDELSDGKTGAHESDVISQILEEYSNRFSDRKEVQDHLLHLKERGELLQPSTDYWRTT